MHSPRPDTGVLGLGVMPLLRHLDEIFNSLKDTLDTQPTTTPAVGGPVQLPDRSGISRALDGTTRLP